MSLSEKIRKIDIFQETILLTDDVKEFIKEENNLIALCHTCHMQTNHNRKEWQQYLKKV